MNVFGDRHTGPCEMGISNQKPAALDGRPWRWRSRHSHHGRAAMCCAHASEGYGLANTAGAVRARGLGHATYALRSALADRVMYEVENSLHRWASLHPFGSASLRALFLPAKQRELSMVRRNRHSADQLRVR
jgi:hypothetical protein